MISSPSLLHECIKSDELNQSNKIINLRITVHVAQKNIKTLNPKKNSCLQSIDFKAL